MNKIYGPYTAKDGRQRIVIYDGKTRKTVSFPKHLMEKHLGRRLEEYEQVHHIDGDYTNNNIENLEVITFAEHLLKHREEKLKYKEDKKYNCLYCSKEIVLSPLQQKRLTSNLSRYDRPRIGPFCSKSCIGKYGQKIQVSKK